MITDPDMYAYMYPVNIIMHIKWTNSQLVIERRRVGYATVKLNDFMAITASQALACLATPHHGAHTTVA